jgi:hypothetical protein
VRLDDDTEIQDPTPVGWWESPLLQLVLVLAAAGLIASAVWELVQTW